MEIDDGPPKSFELRAGMIAVVPQGAWHRFRSGEGGTSWSATLPGDHIELDVDDPRTAEPQKASRYHLKTMEIRRNYRLGATVVLPSAVVTLRVERKFDTAERELDGNRPIAEAIVTRQGGDVPRR